MTAKQNTFSGLGNIDDILKILYVQSNKCMTDIENDALRQFNLITVHDVMILLLWIVTTK